MKNISEKDIQGLRKAGKTVATVLWEMINHVQPGMTSMQLDIFAGEVLKKSGAKSAPRQTGFPGYTCISVNEIIAHGVPTRRIFQSGDMINIDVSASCDGYFGDVGYTFILGVKNEEAEKICACAKNATMKAIGMSRPGVKVNEIARVIEHEARSNGYTIIKNLCSHGVGKTLHAHPVNILNYYEPEETTVLEAGMAIAWEPYISSYATRAIETNNDWDFTTHNQSIVAQFEHTILITENEPEILTVL